MEQSASDPVEHIRLARASLLALISSIENESVLTALHGLTNALSRLSRNRARAATILKARYGVGQPAESLEQVGHAFGLTRQGVLKSVGVSRQLCPQDTYVPALREMMSRLNAHRPGTYSTAESDLRELLGPGQSLEGAIRFSEDFLDLSSTHQVTAKFGLVSKERVPIKRIGNGLTVLGNAPNDRFKGLLRVSRIIARRAGACHWSDAVEAANNESASVCTRVDFHELVSELPTTHLLDESMDWIWFPDARRNYMLDSAHLIFEGANPHPISIQNIADGLSRRFHSLQHRMPPLALLYKLLIASQIAVGPPDRMLLGPKVNRSRRNAVENTLHAYLRMNDGYADRLDAMSHLCRCCGVTDKRASDIIDRCSFITSTNYEDIYLRGWPSLCLENYEALDSGGTPPNPAIRERSADCQGSE
jgi:hypothetical protein